MDLWVLSFSGVFLSVILYVLLRTRSPEYRVKVTLRFLERGQLPWNREIAEALEQPLVSRASATAGGSATGLVLATVGVLALGQQMPAITGMYIVAMAGILGANVALAVHSLTVKVSWPTSAVTVAHSTVPRVRDHVSMALLITVRIS
ncbi:MAG: hypothetical protein ABWX96_16985, partial [Propionibacteriaceae bacterium]